MTRWLKVRVVLDRGVAAVLLVVLAPVLATLAIVVRLSDGGPAFVAVPRVGRNGRTLRMWKLRSMRADTADGRAEGAGLTSAGDQRITPVGRWLRTLHLDELPQLLNVVKGDMALVGPRPEDPAFVDDSDDWAAVLAAPPALLGPTQLVVGAWERGIITAAPDGSAYLDEVVPVKLAVDTWYLEAASPSLDLLVMLAFLRRVTGGDMALLLRRVARDVPAIEPVLAPAPAEPAPAPAPVGPVLTPALAGGPGPVAAGHRELASARQPVG